MRLKDCLTTLMTWNPLTPDSIVSLQTGTGAIPMTFKSTSRQNFDYCGGIIILFMCLIFHRWKYFQITTGLKALLPVGIAL